MKRLWQTQMSKQKLHQTMLNRQGQLYVQDYCNRVERPVWTPVESKGRRGFKNWNWGIWGHLFIDLIPPPKIVFPHIFMKRGNFTTQSKALTEVWLSSSHGDQGKRGTLLLNDYISEKWTPCPEQYSWILKLAGVF